MRLSRFAALIVVLSLLVGAAAAGGPDRTVTAAVGRAPVGGVLGVAVYAQGAPSVTATKVDAFPSGGDVDMDGRADPGDTIAYTVTITNGGAGDATGLSFSDIIDPNTTLVSGSANISPLAMHDNYVAVGNTLLRVGNPPPTTGASTSSATKVTQNDMEYLGDSFTISAFQATSAQGGTVTMVTSGADMGSFTYLPAAGYTGTDTFTYTIRDDGTDGMAGNADDLTDTATVTIVVSEMVWFVDDSAAPGGDGRSTAPFQTLAPLSTGGTADSSDNADDYIYVFAGSYSSGIVLEQGQRLIGAGSALTVGALSVAAGTAPTISAVGGTAITLASGNTLAGFTVGDSTIDITGTSFGTLAVGNVTLSGTGRPLLLTTGTLSGLTDSTARFNSISTTSATLDAFKLDGVGGVLDVAGTSSFSGIADRGVAILNSSVNVTFATLNITGGAIEGLVLGGNTGNFASTSGTISGVPGVDVHLLNGTGTIAIGQSITNTSGLMISVNNYDTGNITFSGNLSSNAAAEAIGVSGTENGAVTFSGGTKTLTSGASGGVRLTSNTGSTIRFTGGGLAITTTTGTGFDATGGGVVEVQGANNTISAGTGTALNVVSTTIGAAGLTFRSISANGAASGIVLNTTGSSGGLTVTGNGASTATGTRGTLSASLNSGGTIQNTTGDAIVLNTVPGGVTLRSMVIGDASATHTQTKDTTVNIAGDGIDITNSDNIVLENLKIARTGGHGITGTGVTNFSMKNSDVLNAGNANDEDGLHFAGTPGANRLDGMASIIDSRISGSYENNAYISNSTGTLNLTVTNSLFTRTANTSSLLNGEEGLKIETVTGGSNPQITATVTNSEFDNLESDGIAALANAGTMILTATSNQFTGLNTLDAKSDNGISLGTSGSAVQKYSISANTFTNSYNDAIILSHNDNSVIDGIIQNNIFTGSSVGGGIGGALAADDNSNTKLRIAGNTMSNLNGVGVFLNANNTGTLNATVTSNTIGSPVATDTFENLTVQGTGTSQVTAKIEGNDVKNGGDGGIGGGFIAEAIYVAQVTSSTVRLERGSSASNVAQTVLDDNNPLAEPGTSTMLGVEVFGTVTVVNNGTVLPPTVPLLFAAQDAAPVVATPATEERAGVAIDSAPAVAAVPGVEMGSEAREGQVDTAAPSGPVLDGLVVAAVARWSATGLSAAQMAALASVTVDMADLPGRQLGAAAGTHITLDDDAAGNGWFIDPTPFDDSEFSSTGTRLTAVAGGPAAGKVDALTTLLHELGHVLGLEDRYEGAARDSLLYGYATLGERRLPAVGEAQGALAGSVAAEAYQMTPDISAALGTLPAGKTITIVFRVTVNAMITGGATNVCNQGTVSGSNISNVLTDDPAVMGTANPTCTLLDAPDLSVTKSDGGASVTPGGTVAYTLSYGNTGGANATGVTLTETVPANTTFNAGASTAGWTCTPDNNAGSTCTLSVGSVAASANGSATFAVTVVNPVAAGVAQISNTATIADDGTHGADPTPSNNSGSDTTPVNATPDMSISKSDGGAFGSPGGTITYTLSYANNGNQGATGVTLTETVPANTTFNAGASTAGWSCTPNANAGSTCTLSAGTVAGGGGSGTATFAVTVAGMLPGGVTQISNTASVSDDGANGTDSMPANNSAGDTTPLLQAPAASKSFTESSVPLNGTTTLTVTLTNPNTAQALSSVGFTDNLPAGIRVAATPGTTNDCGGTVTIGGSNESITLDGGDLAAGADCTVTVAVVGTAVGSWSNTATPESAETGTGVASAPATLVVVGPPGISKAFGAASVALNGTTSLTVTLSNPMVNTVALTGVGVTDTLPSGLALAAVPNPQTSGCGSPMVSAPANGATLTISGATIGVSGTCTLTVQVRGTAAGNVTNTTDAVTSANGGDGGTAMAMLTVVAPPVIAKTFSPAGIGLNETSTLTITVTNPAANTVALTGVGYTDTLPAGVVIYSTPNLSTTGCGMGVNATTAMGSISLNGATVVMGTPCVVTVTVQGTSAGAKNNAVQVTSVNGGTGNTAMATLTVDNIPPLVTVTFPAPPASGWFTDPSVAGTVSATDPSNVTAISCTPAAVQVGALSGAGTMMASADLTITAEGSHSVVCTATDGAGNSGAGPGSANTATVRIDRTPPTTTATTTPASPNANGWYNAPVTVTLTATDQPGLSGVATREYRLDGGAWTAYSGPFSISTDGEHTVEYRSTDVAGNVEEPKMLTVRIDRTAPELRFRFDPATRGVVVEGFEADGSGLSSSGPISPTICAPQRTGEQCLYRATDLAGNASTMTLLITKSSTSTSVRVVSVQYPGAPARTPATHSVVYTFSPATGGITTLTQTLTVTEGLTSRRVEARYPAPGMPGSTLITTTVGGSTTSQTCPGQTLLWLRTARTATGVNLTIEPPACVP